MVGDGSTTNYFHYHGRRFRVKIEAEDNGVAGTFVLFDTDCQQLLNKSCKDLVVIHKVFFCVSLPEVIRLSSMLHNNYIDFGRPCSCNLWYVPNLYCRERKNMNTLLR